MITVDVTLATERSVGSGEKGGKLGGGGVGGGAGGNGGGGGWRRPKTLISARLRVRYLPGKNTVTKRPGKPLHWLQKGPGPASQLTPGCLKSQYKAPSAPLFWPAALPIHTS